LIDYILKATSRRVFNDQKKTRAYRSKNSAVNAGYKADKYIKYCKQCNRCWENQRDQWGAIDKTKLIYYVDFVTYGKVREICKNCT